MGNVLCRPAWQGALQTKGGYTAAQEGFLPWWFLPEASLVLSSSSVKGESHGTHHMGLWGE